LQTVKTWNLAHLPTSSFTFSGHNTSDDLGGTHGFGLQQINNMIAALVRNASSEVPDGTITINLGAMPVKKIVPIHMKSPMAYRGWTLAQWTSHYVPAAAKLSSAAFLARM